MTDVLGPEFAHLNTALYHAVIFHRERHGINMLQFPPNIDTTVRERAFGIFQGRRQLEDGLPAAMARLKASRATVLDVVLFPRLGRSEIRMAQALAERIDAANGPKTGLPFSIRVHLVVRRPVPVGGREPGRLCILDQPCFNSS
jgi:hypothetical protein